jgi:Rrf2 family protein
MKFSTRARYALKMMVEIANNSETGQAISLGEVADKANISRRYLEQLAIALKNASLLHGIAGKGGGYVLTQSAYNIKIGDIVAAVIGPINVVDCVSRPEVCAESDSCEFRTVYQDINQRIVKVLSDISLAELADRTVSARKSILRSTSSLGCPMRKNKG